MKLSWHPLGEDSEPIAVAREGDKSSYRVVYITRTPDGAEEEADDYVTSGVSSMLTSKTGKRRHDQSIASDESGSSRLTLPPGGKWQFEPVPPPPPEKKGEKVKREILVVTGRSGCGKSYWIRAYVRNYLKLYPEHSVYLISSLSFDDTLDEVPELKRIDLDKLVANPPKDVKTWKDSLVIIDDVEGLDGVKTAAVQRVQDMIASEGRHEGTTLVRAAHNSTDGRKTRLLLNEAHAFVIYPRSGSTNQIEYLLTKYAGMSKKSADAIMSLPSRWVMLHHSEPRYVLTSSTISLLA